MKTLNKLEEFLVARIKAHGPISLGEFMSHALCHPRYGYYQVNDPFGSKGDFTTAPEISQIFGEVIGAWVVDTWKQMGAPQSFNLIECGPGRGTLMADALRGTSGVQGFLDATNICLVENSTVLRKKQQKQLSQYSRVRWWSDISEIDDSLPVIIIGNEFLDALPVEHLMRNESGWQKKEVCVTDDDKLSYEWSPAQQHLLSFLPAKTSSNETYEISPVRHDFVAKCAGVIRSKNGAALMFDYGYELPCCGDTLQAVRKHEYASVLSDVGLNDITAHVDFSSVVSAAKSSGCLSFPVRQQGQFLASIGAQYRAQYLENCAAKIDDSEKRQEVLRDIRTSVDRLMSPNEMGELFKVCCFYSGFNFNAAGFCA